MPIPTEPVRPRPPYPLTKSSKPPTRSSSGRTPGSRPRVRKTTPLCSKRQVRIGCCGNGHTRSEGWEMIICITSCRRRGLRAARLWGRRIPLAAAKDRKIWCDAKVSDEGGWLASKAFAGVEGLDVFGQSTQAESQGRSNQVWKFELPFCSHYLAPSVRAVGEYQVSSYRRLS